MIGWEISRIVYKGDGITKEFPYTYTVQEKAEMVVTLVHEDGTNEILAKDYFVDLDKKTVNYPGYAPGEEPAEAERPGILPTGAYLVLSRSIPITQETYLGDKWPWNVNEDELDKITMILQDLKEESDRHLTLSAEVEGVNVTLPSPKPNMGFYWDETGTKLVEVMNPKEATERAEDSAARAKTSEERAEAAATRTEELAEKVFEGIDEAKQAATDARASADEAAASAANAKQAADESYINAERAAEKAAAAKDSEIKAADSADRAEAVVSTISGPLFFKGGVETYGQLPVNPSIGDVWFVEKSDEYQHSTGNYVWNGEQWIFIGNGTDITIATDEEIEELFYGEYRAATDPEIIAVCDGTEVDVGGVTIYDPLIPDLFSADTPDLGEPTAADNGVVLMF